MQSYEYMFFWRILYNIMDPLPLAIIIVVLILLSGFFSGTETAFSCANKIKLKSMVMLGKKHAKAVHKFADETTINWLRQFLLATIT